MISAGLDIRDDSGHVVVTLRGELDAAGAPGLMAVLTAAVVRNPRIIADLAALEYIDCCALGVLGRVRAQAQRAGGDLLLAAPHGLVRRILTLTGLTGAFPVYAGVNEAARATGYSCPRQDAAVTAP